jgi:hypothetical protein
MPANAFGPQTDTDMAHHRPRLVNSGTMMGPVCDMRALCRAIWDVVQKTYDLEADHPDSDQKYFGDVFAI